MYDEQYISYCSRLTCQFMTWYALASMYTIQANGFVSID